MSGLPVAWVAREPPLPISGAAARGDAAGRWVARLLAAPELPWRGIGGPGWLVILGDEIPWVDGLQYLGRDPVAPRLLLPTHTAPEAAGVPVAALVDRWAAARCGGDAGPYAVLPGWAIVPLGDARTVDAGALARWRP